MAKIDIRFALVRDEKPWYAVLIAEREGRAATYRVSQRGVSRDAHGQSEKLTDVEMVVKRVLQEGKRHRDWKHHTTFFGFAICVLLRISFTAGVASIF
jgi:hypothetical protein